MFSIAFVAKTFISNTLSSIETQQTRKIFALLDKINLFQHTTHARLLVSIEVASSRENLFSVKVVVAMHQHKRAFRQRLHLLTYNKSWRYEWAKKEKEKKKNKQTTNIMNFIDLTTTKLMMITIQIIITRDRVESTQLRDKYNKELRNNYELFINNHQLFKETIMIKKFFFFFLFTRFRKIFNEFLKLATRELRHVNEDTMTHWLQQTCLSLWYWESIS